MVIHVSLIKILPNLILAEPAPPEGPIPWSFDIRGFDIRG